MRRVQRPGGPPRSRWRGGRLPAVVAVCAGMLLGCRPQRDPNVLFLVIDALRPDHLGCYGYPRPTSPTLDRLARRGVLFTDVTSPASYTRAAVASIFASVYPGAHGVFSQRRQVEALSDEYVTLAEALKARGYATAAFMPNPSLNRAFNFDQGFDHYDDDFELGGDGDHQDFETARKINERALRWLRGRRDRPFFAYLHYRDVHAPYVPPPPYDRLFAAAGERRLLTSDEYRRQPTAVRQPRRFRDLESYLEQYDGAIRYTDDQLARFLDALSREGFLERTLLVVTADHGESFLEHGAWTHGTGVFEEEIRVPLLLVLPGDRHAGRRVSAPVQTIDLYPTVAAWLGATVPDEVQGRDLLAAVAGRADPRRPVFSEARVGNPHRPAGLGQLVAVRADGWKLVVDRTRRATRLYHLAADPRETIDLAASEPQRVRELRRLLQAFDRDNARRRHRQAGEARLSAEALAGLRALGYLE